MHMENNKWDIWMEGYTEMGEQHQTAQKLNKTPVEAVDFDGAVKNFFIHIDPSLKPYLSKSNLTGEWLVWGCALHDNEQDARKRFG